MAEEILSNEERNNILKKVSESNKVEEKTGERKSVNLAENKSDPDSFGSLLEQTIVQREEMAKEDEATAKHIDETREQAIKASRLDILKDFKL